MKVVKLHALRHLKTAATEGRSNGVAVASTHTIGRAAKLALVSAKELQTE